MSLEQLAQRCNGASAMLHRVEQKDRCREEVSRQWRGQGADDGRELLVRQHGMPTVGVHEQRPYHLAGRATPPAVPRVVEECGSVRNVDGGQWHVPSLAAI